MRFSCHFILIQQQAGILLLSPISLAKVTRDNKQQDERGMVASPMRFFPRHGGHVTGKASGLEMSKGGHFGYQGFCHSLDIF